MSILWYSSWSRRSVSETPLSDLKVEHGFAEKKANLLSTRDQCIPLHDPRSHGPVLRSRANIGQNIGATLRAYLCVPRYPCICRPANRSWYSRPNGCCYRCGSARSTHLHGWNRSPRDIHRMFHWFDNSPASQTPGNRENWCPGGQDGQPCLQLEVALLHNVLCTYNDNGKYFAPLIAVNLGKSTFSYWIVIFQLDSYRLPTGRIFKGHQRRRANQHTRVVPIRIRRATHVPRCFYLHHISSGSNSPGPWFWFPTREKGRQDGKETAEVPKGESIPNGQWWCCFSALSRAPPAAGLCPTVSPSSA